MTKKSEIEGMAARLLDVPPPDRELTKKEALENLLPTLKKMQARGHTLDSIRASLEAEGLRVSVRAIRQVLGTSRGRKGARASASQRNAE